MPALWGPSERSAWSCVAAWGPRGEQSVVSCTSAHTFPMEMLESVPECLLGVQQYSLSNVAPILLLSGGNNHGEFLWLFFISFMWGVGFHPLPPHVEVYGHAVPTTGHPDLAQGQSFSAARCSYPPSSPWAVAARFKTASLVGILTRSTKWCPFLVRSL